jgi:hypothetical protein
LRVRERSEQITSRIALIHDLTRRILESWKARTDCTRRSDCCGSFVSKAPQVPVQNYLQTEPTHTESLPRFVLIFMYSHIQVHPLPPNSFCGSSSGIHPTPFSPSPDSLPCPTSMVLYARSLSFRFQDAFRRACRNPGCCLRNRKKEGSAVRFQTMPLSVRRKRENGQGRESCRVCKTHP